MTEQQIRVMQEVQRLLGKHVTVASQASRTSPAILSKRLVMLSGAPDNAEGWRLAFRMMMEISIITPRQKKVLDDAFQPGAPLRVRTERKLKRRGLGHLLRSSRWNRQEAQVWAFQFHMEGAVSRNTVGRLFELAKYLFYRLRHLVMGVGFEAAEDIFRQAAKGILGRKHDQRIEQQEAARKSAKRKYPAFVVSEDEQTLASYTIEATSWSQAQRLAIRKFQEEWKARHGQEMPPRFYVDRYPGNAPASQAAEDLAEEGAEALTESTFSEAVDTFFREAG